MGTTFSFDDMNTSRFADIYDAKLVSEDGDKATLEMTSKGEAPYAKAVVVIDTTMGHPLEMKYYNDKGVHVKHYFSLEHDIEASLAYMIHKWGPVSVAVDFTKQHGYKGGVLTADQCSDTANHAVLAVGYTPDYWILKNSMGTEWGDQGYAYLERNAGACAIETYAAVATQVDIK